MADLKDVLNKAREKHTNERYREAEQLYTSVIEQWEYAQNDPNENLPSPESVAVVYNDRGHCHYKMVLFDEAIKDLTQALELDPKLASAFYTRGTIHYRLCSSQRPEERTVPLRKAVDDLHMALKLEPQNEEFKLGLDACKKLLSQTVDKVPKVLDLSGVSLAKLAQLIFLLDPGDPGTGSSESQRHRNIVNALQGRHALLSAFTSPDYQWLSTLLQFRALELKKHMKVVEYFTRMELQENSEAADWAIRRHGEDLLVFAEAFRFLSLPCHNLKDEVSTVEKIMKLTETEKNGNFFLYAENLLISRICKELTPSLVYKFFHFIKNSIEYGTFVDDFQITEEKLIKEEGMKEILFFYLIRVLESNKLLNRIYTDILKNLFEDVRESCNDDEEKRIICSIISRLQIYPTECTPAGLCVIFCVTDDRSGTDFEINKIESVFHDQLGFTVLTEKNPNKGTLEKYMIELKKPKYNFYDSFVFWSISHGTENDIVLAGNESYPRKDFIHNFSLPDNFRKKPKIFFMASCGGSKLIQVKEEGGMNVAADGGVPPISPDDIPIINQDIGSVYYQMDRIIAYASLPEKLAFRTDDKGSIFVDEVCSLIEKRRGENLTVVLEEARRRIHRILFAANNSEFQGSAKQASYHESTLQKTFLIP